LFFSTLAIFFFEILFGFKFCVLVARMGRSLACVVAALALLGWASLSVAIFWSVHRGGSGFSSASSGRTGFVVRSAGDDAALVAALRRANDALEAQVVELRAAPPSVASVGRNAGSPSAQKRVDTLLGENGRLVAKLAAAPAPKHLPVLTMVIPTMPRRAAKRSIDYLGTTLEGIARQMAPAFASTVQILVVNNSPGDHPAFDAARKTFASQPQFVFVENTDGPKDPFPNLADPDPMNNPTNRPEHVVRQLTCDFIHALQTAKQRTASNGFITIVRPSAPSCAQLPPLLSLPAALPPPSPARAHRRPLAHAHTLASPHSCLVPPPARTPQIEDDFLICPRGLADMLKALVEVQTCQPKGEWTHIPFSYGMNGITVQVRARVCGVAARSSYLCDSLPLAYLGRNLASSHTVGVSGARPSLLSAPAAHPPSPPPPRLALSLARCVHTRARTLRTSFPL
jgi:hypothetical protein